MGTTPDLFGLALLDYLDGRREPVHLRREDGRLAVLRLEEYFCGSPFSVLDATLLEHARGHVLDLGAGAGRVAGYLRQLCTKGLADLVSVTSLDSSAGACRCLRLQSLGPVVQAAWQEMASVTNWFERWDTVLTLGSGLGMAATPAGLAALLAAIAFWLKADGMAIVTASKPDHRQITIETRETRFRLEYRGLCGPWFSWLMVSPGYLTEVACHAGLAPIVGPVYGEDGEYGIVLRRHSSEEA